MLILREHNELEISWITLNYHIHNEDIRQIMGPETALTIITEAKQLFRIYGGRERIRSESTIKNV